LQRTVARVTSSDRDASRDALVTARRVHTDAVVALASALIAGALDEVAEVLPGTVSLEVLGETNEDGLDILRIQRVRNAQGDVLYDIETGHLDRAVEDRIDHVGSEYLDQLLDITYGEFFGEHVLLGETTDGG